nr:GDSL-type esterase/lipase family protein [Ruania rhizosphaerae]
MEKTDHGLRPRRTGGPAIYLAGDSTVASRPIHEKPSFGWGSHLGAELNALVTARRVQRGLPPLTVPVCNFAQGGASTESFRESGLWGELLGLVRGGDVVLIQFGHNDAKHEHLGAGGQYRTNLIRFVDEVEAAGATPVLCTSVARRVWDGATLTDTHGRYPQVVRELATERSLSLIDLHAMTHELYERLGPEGSVDYFTHRAPSTQFPDGLQDDSHSSFLGARTIGEYVADAIVDLVLAAADASSDATESDTGGSTRRVDPITGSTIRQLTHGRAHSVHGYYDLPPWSRADGRIAFSRHRGSSDGEICVMGPDGSDLTVVARSAAMTANDGAMPQWSADGARLYFRDVDERGPLVSTVDMATGALESTPGDLRMMRPGHDELVYFTDRARRDDESVRRSKTTSGVVIRSFTDAGERTVATVQDALDLHPRRAEIADWHLYIKHTKWSRDGQRLMFVFTNEKFYDTKFAELPRVKDLYSVNADGSDLRRLGEFGNHPSWHPDGRRLLANAAFGDRPGYSLVLIDTLTGDRELAADAIGGHGHPSFSPDGRWIVVDHVINSEGIATLNLIDTTDHSIRQLVEVAVTDHSHRGTHLHPVWSHDSRSVLFASDASGYSQLCVVDI